MGELAVILKKYMTRILSLKNNMEVFVSHMLTGYLSLLETVTVLIDYHEIEKVNYYQAV